MDNMTVLKPNGYGILLYFETPFTISEYRVSHLNIYLYAKFTKKIMQVKHLNSTRSTKNSGIGYFCRYTMIEESLTFTMTTRIYRVI